MSISNFGTIDVSGGDGLRSDGGYVGLVAPTILNQGEILGEGTIPEPATGLPLLGELESLTFSDLVRRNTDATNMPMMAFTRSDYTFDMAAQTDPNGIVDDPNTPYNEPNLDGTSKLIRMPDGTIRLTGRGTTENHSTWMGTNGDDTLQSAEGDDTLWGNDGNDRLEGGVGADKLDGGYGNDILTDSTGNDILRGGAGSDVLYGGRGLDLLFGNSGDDAIFHGSDDKESFAGTGDDIVVGGTGFYLRWCGALCSVYDAYRVAHTLCARVCRLVNGKPPTPKRPAPSKPTCTA